MRRQDRGVVFGVIDLPDRQQQLASRNGQPAGDSDIGADRSKAGDAMMDDQTKIPLEHLVHRAVQHLVGDPLVICQQLSGEDVARENHRLTVGCAPRSTTSTSWPGWRLSCAASLADAGSNQCRPCSVPACMPAARIASVTPKFVSRLFATREPCATYVPEPHIRRTTPSPSRVRSASRRVARDTPSSLASAGSDGSRVPAASTPRSIRSVIWSRTETLRGRARVFIGLASFGIR